MKIGVIGSMQYIEKIMEARDELIKLKCPIASQKLKQSNQSLSMKIYH